MLPQLSQTHPDQRIKVSADFPKTTFHRRYSNRYKIFGRFSISFQKISMHRVLYIIVLISFVGFCTAQVNFSPNWGKRGFNPGNDDNGNNCRENMDNIVLIYKLIQVCTCFFKSFYNTILLSNYIFL